MHVPPSDDIAGLLVFIAQSASPKECVLALAEELEQLCAVLQTWIVEERDDDDDREGEHNVQRVIVVVRCFTEGPHLTEVRAIHLKGMQRHIV